MIFIEIRQTQNMGRGVFATKKIAKDQIIEICPVYILSPKEVKIIASTKLENWFYSWKKNLDAMLFGYGMIYNHSFTPNAAYFYDYANETIIFKSILTIKKGEQIFINYNQHGDHKNNEIPMFHPQTKKYLTHKPTSS